MLTELHVEHLGVLDRLDLVLGPGLTVVTGETGAGKTLIVDAIGLLVGGRAAGDLVRAEAGEARVEGRFVVNDDEHVLARVQPRDGRSRAYVDGRLATATQLGDLGQQWAELHGQHHHQSLVRRRVQREALDRFAGVDTTALRLARSRLTELDAELAALGGDHRARARELDLLRHQIAEIEAAALDDPDEDQRLEAEQDLLADAVEHRRVGEAAWEALRGEDGVYDALGRARRALESRSPFRSDAARLDALLAELDDVADSVRRRVEQLEEDPERLAQVIQRRRQLKDLRRRYGDTLADVGDFARTSQDRVEELLGFEHRSSHLDAERARVEAEVRQLARQVGDARRRAAVAMGAAVTEQVRRLALAHATVTVTVGDPDTDPGGDAVALWFTANPGADPLPLARVASGGELSRVMLALRLVLGVGPDTLIFDEVDAGIGGEAAAAVAEALAQVARGRQVLVVTHLAQVAARADHHLVVDKQVLDGRSHATVTAVTGEARVTEIARMLSGRPHGDRARHLAAELLAAQDRGPIDAAGERPG